MHYLFNQIEKNNARKNLEKVKIENLLLLFDFLVNDEIEKILITIEEKYLLTHDI